MDTALTVVSPPSCEPVSLERLRRHTRIDYEDDDDLLAIYLATARTLAEQYLSRALITQTLQWSVGRRLMPQAAGPTPYAPLFFPGGNAFGLPRLGRTPLELPRSPVVSVSSVSLMRPDGTTQLLASDKYILDNVLQPAHLRILPDAIEGPIQHLSTIFEAGYGADPSVIPVPIVQAVMMIASYLYENRGDTDAQIPAAAEALLAPYRLITFGG